MIEGKLATALGLTAGLALGLVLAGCGGVDGDETPTILAASSLTDVLPRIVPNAAYSFGGSNQLAQQIRSGAPFDVFITASPRYTGQLNDEGLVREPTVFASNSLVLIVPEGNPAGIRTVDDIGVGTTRLVVAAPEVPAGAYTRELLERMGAAGVLRSVASEEPDVKGVVGKVALGEADAGVVYATDVAPVAAVVEVIELPAAAQPSVAYEVAIAAAPDNPAAAEAFVRALLGATGRSELVTAGFTVP